MGNGRLDLLMALTALPMGTATPDYSVAAAPSGATITAGQMASFSVSAAPTGGFNQSINWTCTGAPMASTCTVSPASSPVDGSTVATSTVSVMTTMRSAAAPASSQQRFAPPALPWQVLQLSIACLLAALTLHKLRRVGRAPRLLSASAVLALAVYFVSCGSGNGSSSGPGPGPPPPAQGTPAGTYTITVTGTSGSLSHSASFQLVVK
jgi:hypothetical protein